MFLAPHHWKKLFPVQLRTKLLFQLPEMVKNMPRTHKHTHTHEKDTTLRCCTNLNRLIQTTVEIARHYTTLRRLPTCIALAAEHLQLLLKFVDFLAFPWIMTGAYPNPQRLLWWHSPLIQRYTKKLWNLKKVCLKSFEKYFQAFGIIQFSFHSRVFFFSPNRTSLCPKSRA